jgi:hypothetical protein
MTKRSTIALLIRVPRPPEAIFGRVSSRSFGRG